MSLNYFFAPKSVAVVGASANPAKIGRQVLDNIIKGGFEGQIYPINLQEKEVAGLPAYADLTQLPKGSRESLLVVIAIPASLVVVEIKKCILSGIKNIIIISAGFKEAGEEGRQWEEEIKSLAEKNQLNILGPNCLGFINTAAKLNATFGAAKMEKGRVALLSQSGAVGSAILDWLRHENFNLRYFASLGNKAVLQETDFLDYLADDKEIDLIACYLESVKDGEKFMSQISGLVKKKPIAILHAGESQAGTSLALSHSGALAGSTASFQAGLERSGALRLAGMRELFDLLKFSQSDWKGNADNRLSVMTNAGGPSILAVDEISRLGLELGKDQDLLGDADAARYSDGLDKMLSNKEVSNLLVLLTPQTSTQPDKTAEAIVKAKQKYPSKTIIASFIGGEAVLSAREILAKAGIAEFEYPEDAVRAFKHVADYRKIVKTLRPYKNLFRPSKEKILDTDYLESFKFLEHYDIPTVETSRYEESKLSTYKYPVVLKMVGPDFLHKSDKGCIVVGLKTAEELRQEAGKLKKAYASQIADTRNYLVIQEQCSDFQEIILGFKRDQAFGPIMMVGWGGIYTEAMKDVKLSIGDFDKAGALEILKGLKVFTVLNGARGHKPYDLKALADTLVKLARLAGEHPEIKEFDINPLFVFEKGVSAGDVRIIL